MDRRLAPLLIIPLLLVSFLAGWHLGQPDYMLGEEQENVITITPILRIYDENGALIYEKVGDPPTDNLAKLFLLQAAPRFYNDGTEFTISSTVFNGNAVALNPDSNYRGIDVHTVWVLAGTGTTPPSRQDYTVTLAGYSEAKVLNFFFDTATNEWVLQVTGVITFTNSFNITEVGLSVDNYLYGSTSGVHDPATAPGANFLVFRDLLPQPISVANGDSLTIQYELRVKLP